MTDNRNINGGGNEWRIGKILVLAVGLAAVAACRQTESPKAVSAVQFDAAAFDGHSAFMELERFLALGSRDAGTDGALKAAQYLQSRLVELGLQADVDEFTDISPAGSTLFRNVVARRAGTGPDIVILAGHFDTKAGMPKGFQGANDSGSSTAVLLEMAGLIARAPEPPMAIWFVFFDGEECMAHYGPQDGLHGSRHLVRQLSEKGLTKDVRAMILLDMVGDRDLTPTIPRNCTSELVSALFDAAREEGARAKFSLYPYPIGDDHEPFLRAGIPAIDIIDFHYGSAPGRNDHWHTGADTLDKISSESLETVGRVTLRLLNGILNAE